jgi:hypothetical protein
LLLVLVAGITICSQASSKAVLLQLSLVLKMLLKLLLA